MTGANSAAALRSTPASYLALGEVDGFPPDCGGEGDPVALAIARTVTFAGVVTQQISRSVQNRLAYR